jgi:hypothetical protein
MTADAEGARSASVGMGRPRNARTCSSNSERFCDIRVTMPVSCGRGDLGEVHLVAADKKLHAEQALAAEGAGDLVGDLLALASTSSFMACGCQDSR